MLVAPTHCEPFRLLAIDPGTETMGIALMELGVEKPRCHVRNAFTIVGKDNHPAYQTTRILHSARQARLEQLGDLLGNTLNEYQPHSVIYESPFLGRFPQTYGALIECMTLIRTTVHFYDPYMVVYRIDPISAKQAAGVAIKKKVKLKKEDVSNALAKRNDIIWHVDLAGLDEHSVDAIAVGLYHFQNDV